MESWEKDYERYVQRYARQYCNGDTKEAETHMMVKQVKEHYIHEHELSNKKMKTFLKKL